jgi:hypothetical protein
MCIILSENGKTVLMVDGYNYGFQKHLANEIKRWICNKETCKAYLKTNLNGEIQFSSMFHT